jgi:hypothetical protein
MRIPYTYIISSTDGHLYVGSKYGVDAHPDKLLKSYFTSSNYAKPLILEDPSKWSIIRLREGETTEEVVAVEMEWQMEHRYNKGLLNKSINRAQGKWVNYGPKSDAARRKLSDTKKGKPASRATIEAARQANLGRACPEHVKEALRVAKTGVPRSEVVRTNISAAMKRNQTSVGAKNSNTTKWTLRSPDDVVFTQPETLSGKEFIQGLGLSYQMLIKFRSKNQVFGGKLTGWEVLDCSRLPGQNHHRSGRSIKNRSE